MQSASAYIGHRHGTISQWMLLLRIVEVYASKWCYEGRGGGGRRGIKWWFQESPEVTLRETLEEEISQEARVRPDSRDNR